jgi:hypothetical protein
LSGAITPRPKPPPHLRFQSRPPGYLSRVRHHRLRQKSNMASGKLKIEVLPAGAVVPAFQLL